MFLLTSLINYTILSSFFIVYLWNLPMSMAAGAAWGIVTAMFIGPSIIIAGTISVCIVSERMIQ